MTTGGWLRRLRAALRCPTVQTNAGDSGIQIGDVAGGVTIIHQHISVQPCAAPSGTAAALPMPPGCTRALGLRAEQRAVLRLLDQVPDRRAVIDFMRRTFQTTRVMRLNAAELRRVRRYCEACITHAARAPRGVKNNSKGTKE